MEWDSRRIGHRLKLRDLNVLMTVARCGSMGKAAAQLSVTQPAISKAIAEMEHTLGVRLLDRSPLGVEPTIYASALLDHGVIAFDELQQALRKIEGLVDPRLGHVRIGSSVVLAEGFVAAIINRLSRQYPRMSFYVSAEESGMTYRALEERKVDLAILALFEPVTPSHLSAEILYHEPHLIAAGIRSPWTKRRGVQLAALMHEPWVLPPSDSLTGALVQEVFDAAGLAVPDAVVITSSTPARYALVASGPFLTILPAFVLGSATRKPTVRALPIELATGKRPIAIITLKNRAISLAAQRFIDCAHEVAKLSVG